MIDARHVLIDLLTDSGTSAMSSNQWAGIMQETNRTRKQQLLSFRTGSKRYHRYAFYYTYAPGAGIRENTFQHIGGKGKFFVSNTLFDTTRANIEFSGATGVDLLCEEGKHPAIPAPFKGNLDTVALEQFINKTGSENIPAVILTITNNSGGGQPVSMQNIREVKAICKANCIPFYIDACRFAENAYFIKLREEGYQNSSIEDIAREMFSYADGATMSAKKMHLPI
ncbi:beta-eliminating lyase-related protein [Niabella sp. W65]|nr:beta-eliminating lyase-related protein [Niabella sp. W65]MCH7366845.1 beta-eliminating lyase-related protein [Niabella sp. W65]ULT42544.1 beta-eliminating lyase-related protein [Niabella sp. I65]